MNDIAGRTITDTVTAEPLLIVKQRARIKEMSATIARLEADNARHTDPLAESFKVPKMAASLSDVPRQTLEYWAEHDMVRHYHDAHGQLWIDVVDARRQRYLLAPLTTLANLGIKP